MAVAPTWLPSWKVWLSGAMMDFGSSALSHAERVAEAALLLRQLLHAVPEATIRAINVPPGDALRDALISLKCPAILRQHEMLIRLPLPNTHEAVQV